MNEDIYNESEYPNLIELVNSGKCVVFVGSGLSAGLYPSWGDLVTMLCVECGLPAPSPEDLESVDFLLDQADAARARNEEGYCRVLGRAFGGPPAQTRLAYDYLMRLPFQSYVTINFDPLLPAETRKPEHKCGDVYSFPDLPHHKIHTRSVYCIHGYINNAVPRADQVLLGRRALDRAYSDEGGTLKSFLNQLFTYQPIVFIGCTLREPPLVRVFETCHQVRKTIEKERPGHPAPRRFALLPQRSVRDNTTLSLRRHYEAEEEENSRLSELDIAVVRYHPRDERHSNLERALEGWCGLAPVKIRSGFEEARQP